MTLFGKRVFTDDQIKMKSLGWTLIQYDRYPYKEGKFRHRDRYTLKEGNDNVKT